MKDNIEKKLQKELTQKLPHGFDKRFFKKLEKVRKKRKKPVFWGLFLPLTIICSLTFILVQKRMGEGKIKEVDSISIELAYFLKEENLMEKQELIFEKDEKDLDEIFAGLL